MEILRIIYLIVFILFLPGHLLTYVFYPGGKIDLIERIAISFALSISTVPLVVFYMNQIGIPITFESISIQMIFIITLIIMVLLIRYAIKNIKK